MQPGEAAVPVLRCHGTCKSHEVCASAPGDTTDRCVPATCENALIYGCGLGNVANATGFTCKRAVDPTKQLQVGRPCEASSCALADGYCVSAGEGSEATVVVVACEAGPFAFSAFVPAADEGCSIHLPSDTNVSCRPSCHRLGTRCSPGHMCSHLERAMHACGKPRRSTPNLANPSTVAAAPHCDPLRRAIAYAAVCISCYRSPATLGLLLFAHGRHSPPLFCRSPTTTASCAAECITSNRRRQLPPCPRRPTISHYSQC